MGRSFEASKGKRSYGDMRTVDTEKIEKALKEFLSNHDGMVHWMNELFGKGNWVYSDKDKLWIGENNKYIGSGRQFYTIELGGDWQLRVLPSDNIKAKQLTDWYDRTRETQRRLN